MSSNPSISTQLNKAASISFGQPVAPQEWVCDQAQLQGTGIQVNKTITPGKSFGAAANVTFEITGTKPIQTTISFDLVNQTNGAISDTLDLDFEVQ